MTDWRIERLGPHHDRSGFSCGKPPPGDFILKLVIQYEKRNLGRTYVAVKPGELQVRGYYTIGSGAVPFTNLPAPSAHKLPRHPVLVILLARLAVDHSAKGQKLGESLPLDALGRSLTLAEALGIHTVEVNAIDQQARAFIRNLVLAHYIPSPLRKEHLEDSSPRVPFSILISEATIMCGHSGKVGRTTGDRIMPSVVGVHGIAQQFKGPNVLRTEWLPALRDGLWTAGIEFKNDNKFVCAFYGDLFRQPGTKTVGIPHYDTNDVTDDWEKELLDAWWREAATVEKGVPSPEAETKAIRTPRFVQRALNALSGSRFFAGIAERALIFDLKQVRSYLHDQAIRQAVRERVEQAVDPETRVMLGHSLGSVVAYEVLCAYSEWRVRTLVTLGSPLGIRNLIFDLLEPAPQTGIGAWPGSVQRWINIADGGDVVALVKDLRPSFGVNVENH